MGRAERTAQAWSQGQRIGKAAQAMPGRLKSYLLIFSSSASTNSGKAMIARIVTVSPPYIAPAGMAAIMAIAARTAQKQALAIGCALHDIGPVHGVGFARNIIRVYGGPGRRIDAGITIPGKRRILSAGIPLPDT